MIKEKEFSVLVDAGKYITDMMSFDPRIKSEFINTYAAKGPVFLVDSYGPRYMLTDRKDSGYPNVAIRNKLVFRGGNWKKPSEESPMDVWYNQIDDETKPIIKGVPNDTAVRLRQAIKDRTKVLFDYFTALPEELVGNPNLPQPWYCDIASILTSEIPLGLLDDIFQVPEPERTLEGYRQKLNLVSPESPQWLTTIEDLRNGEHVLFGFGDDYKVKDILKELYEIDANIQFFSGSIVVPLGTDANVSFAEREYLKCYLRSDNNPSKRGSLEGGRVFMERDVPRVGDARNPKT